MKTLLLLSLLILLSQATISHSARCHPQDKKALLKILPLLNIPTPTINPNCCDWFTYINCDWQTNRVNFFELYNLNFSGQIPASIGDLPYLENLLFIQLPNLTGTIPPSIGNLTKLTYLYITDTHLSGPIPSFLAQIKTLETLILSSNHFTGQIPNSLPQLQNLTLLSLDRNKLTGSIPDSFGDFPPGFKFLDMSHNRLSGTVPRALGDCNFTQVQLQGNRLKGDVSFLFGKNKTIQFADVSRNLLEFDFSNVEFPASLDMLDLSRNRIYGRLPEGLTGLESVNVSYNRLCGKIPVGGKLQELDYTSFFHNKCLCGSPLPHCK